MIPRWASRCRKTTLHTCIRSGSTRHGPDRRKTQVIQRFVRCGSRTGRSYFACKVQAEPSGPFIFLAQRLRQFCAPSVPPPTAVGRCLSFDLRWDPPPSIPLKLPPRRTWLPQRAAPAPWRSWERRCREAAARARRAWACAGARRRWRRERRRGSSLRRRSGRFRSAWARRVRSGRARTWRVGFGRRFRVHARATSRR